MVTTKVMRGREREVGSGREQIFIVLIVAATDATASESCNDDKFVGLFVFVRFDGIPHDTLNPMRFG